MKKLLLIITSLLLCFSLSSCSLFVTKPAFEIEQADELEMYSREDVSLMAESSSFGKGRSDDVYVTLKFLYNDNTVKDSHGESFEISADDIVCHLSEGESGFLSSAFAGEAEYSVKIDDSVYHIKLEKERDGIWTVISCEKKEG